MPIFAIPKPSLGDTMERKTLNGRHEQALVVSIMDHDPAGVSWQAVLYTRNGTEFVSSDKDHRGIHDWRPAGWVHNTASNCWLPKGYTWDDGTQCLVEVEVEVAPAKVKKTVKSSQSRKIKVEDVGVPTADVTL